MTPTEFKEARERLNMTQQQFADDLGISRTYVSLLEGGTKTPSKTLIVAVNGLLCQAGNQAA